MRWRSCSRRWIRAWGSRSTSRSSARRPAGRPSWLGRWHLSGEPGEGVAEVGGDVGVLPDGIEVAEGVVEDAAGAVGGGPGEGEIGGGGGWEADGGGIEGEEDVGVGAAAGVGAEDVDLVF